VSAPAIRAVGLSKRFRIGERVGYKQLRESIQKAVKASFRRSRRSEETIWALRDVSFEVAPGEVVGVIGRNGAGKSTLLKVISRITEPTEGRVELRGRVGSLLEVGTGFHLELTGRENIYLNGAILGMKRAEIRARFDEIVAFAEVEKFIDTPVKHYSSGMYLRLAFAVAAHLEPEILLVDEVLAVGDASFQKKCLGKMGEVATGGRTVVFVSHNLQAVAHLCARTAHLAEGHLVEVGPTREVVERYLTLGAEDHSAAFSLRPNAAVQVSAIAIVDGQGHPCAELPDDQPLGVRIEVRVNRQFREGIYFGLTVHAADGTNVLFADSRDVEGTVPSVLEPGVYCLSLSVPPLLATGRYFVSVGISTGHYQTLDLRESACSFRLVNLRTPRGDLPRPALINLHLPWTLEAKGASNCPT